MKRLPPALATLLLLATPAAGDGDAATRLAGVEAVAVSVADTVRDYCLPQPMSELHTLQIDAERILRRAGIAVAGGPPAHNLRIAVTGGLRDGACRARLELTLRRAAPPGDGGSNPAPAYIRSIIVEAPEARFQQGVRAAAGAHITALADAIVQARRR